MRFSDAPQTNSSSVFAHSCTFFFDIELMVYNQKDFYTLTLIKQYFDKI